MKFTSTRNKSLSVGFSQAVLNCMPDDGGLYVPFETEDLRRWILYADENTSFASLAGSLTSAMINKVYLRNPLFLKNGARGEKCESISRGDVQDRLPF